MRLVNSRTLRRFNEPTTRLNCGRYVQCVGFSLSGLLTSRMQSISANAPEGTRRLPQEVTSTHTRHLCVYCLSILPHLAPSVSLTGLATNTRKCVNIYPLCCCWRRRGGWLMFLASCKERNLLYYSLVRAIKVINFLVATRMIYTRAKILQIPPEINNCYNFCILLLLVWHPFIYKQS